MLHDITQGHTSVTSHNHTIIHYKEHCKRFQNNNIIQHTLHILILRQIYALQDRLDQCSMDHKHSVYKILSPLVEIDREKKYKVEKILNKRDMREKSKYLVRQKRYTVEKDTWKGLENLGNTMDLVEEFEKKMRKEEIKRVYIRKRKDKKKPLNLEAKILKRSELLGKYTVKILFGQNYRKF